MSYWRGFYARGKVHQAGKGEKTLCHVRIERGWEETSGPLTCKRCVTQIRLREHTLLEIDMREARRA